MRRGWVILALLLGVGLGLDAVILRPRPAPSRSYRCWVWEPPSRDVPDVGCRLWAWAPEENPNGYQDPMWGTPTQYIHKHTSGPKA